jgi:tetratricopeptide (TPR) repeat protein
LALSGGAALESGNAAAAMRSLDEAFELWAAAGQTPTVQPLTAMADACLRLGHIDAAERHIRQALNAQGTADERVHALRVGTYIASERGERARERALLDEALPIAEQLGGLTLARVLCSLSWFDVGRGRLDAATIAATRARDLGQELRHPAMLRESLSLLAAIAVQSGFIEKSLEHSREALVVAVSAGDLESQSLVLGNIGVGHHLLGDERNDDAEFHAAFDHYRQAKVIHERLGRQLHAALSAANMGQVQVRLGNNQTAIDLIHEAIVGVRRSGGRSSLLFCVLAEADRRLTQGDTSALELIGVVRRQPACRKDDFDEVARILARTGLSEADIEHGLQRGASLDFDDVVEQVVNDLAAALDNP